MEVADGKVTGYMEETAFLNCQSRVPMPAPEDLMGAYLRAQDGYARRGVTTVQEGMMIPAMEPLYRQLCAAGLLKLDVVGYLDITQADGMRTALSEHIGQYSGRFKVGGYKTFLDGSPQARTAWLREPYCGAEENYRGYPRMSNEELAGYVDRALDENMQLLATETPPANSICACMGNASGLALRPVSLAGQYVPLSSMRRCLRRTNCPGRHRTG